MSDYLTKQLDSNVKPKTPIKVGSYPYNRIMNANNKQLEAHRDEINFNTLSELAFKNVTNPHTSEIEFKNEKYMKFKKDYREGRKKIVT